MAEDVETIEEEERPAPPPVDPEVLLRRDEALRHVRKLGDPIRAPKLVMVVCLLAKPYHAVAWRFIITTLRVPLMPRNRSL